MRLLVDNIVAEGENALGVVVEVGNLVVEGEDGLEVVETEVGSGVVVIVAVAVTGQTVVN